MREKTNYTGNNMITLQEVKEYLRVDGNHEDASLQAMIDASNAAALDYLNLEGFDSNGMPAPVKAAILLQVGDLYANRERQGDAIYYQNRTYERLLNPYRVVEA